MRNREKWKPTKVYVNKKFGIGKNVPVKGFMMTYHLSSWSDHFRKLQRPEKRVLDLGCGNVPFYEHFENISEYITIDWEGSLHSKSFVDIDLDLNTEGIPLNSKSVDVVLVSDVLEHLHSPEVVLKEIDRVLVENGTLLISTPFLYWLHETPHDYARYSPYWYKKRLGSYEQLSVKTRGGLVSFFFDLIFKLFHKMKLPRVIPYSLLRLYDTRFIRNCDEYTASIFPFCITVNATKK